MSSENIQISISQKQFQKMIFLTNAIENGWSIKKRKDKYIFKKKNDALECLKEDYLDKFIESNIQLTR
jgi:N-acetyl-beta-hexosaminidase